MGYETLVGDMVDSLSGGQMRRVVLARVLYRGPRILLLDEATSHFDAENERRINHAIRLPISRLIVAHRRSAPRYGRPNRGARPAWRHLHFSDAWQHVRGAMEVEFVDWGER